MNAISKLESLGAAILSLFGWDEEEVKEVKVEATEEKFEVQAVDYFTNPTYHREAFDTELHRLRVWSRMAYNRSFKDELDIDRHIDHFVSFKQVFRAGKATAALTRSKSDKHIRYTLESFDHNGKTIHSTSYDAELFDPNIR